MGTNVGLAIRHAMTALGGYFVAKGDLDAGSVEVLAGAVATIFGVVWSVLQKKGLVSV